MSLPQPLGTPELYHLRSTLGVTEPILYASIGFPPSESPSWFTLHQENVSLRLRKILSLPSRLLMAVVTVGSDMYVLGGSVSGKPTSDVNLIDCRFHTSRSLPSMKRTRSRAVAGAIDGNIYVIGGCTKNSDDWAEAFDVKTQTWRGMPGALVQWDDGGELKKLWQASSCVVDDMLYTIDLGRSLKHPIIVYDPKAKEKRWRPVYGVNLSRDLRPLVAYYDSKMANLGGKLLILVGSIAMPFSHCESEQVWCVKIALERRGDEIFGHVESTEVVLKSNKCPSIELSRTVTL
uniref:FKB95-like N-terminal Kelch domain-containing protein n=1 Tax=Brassica oleracea var. oleracea TaxID=109376 RepID=A0A0D3DT44_BRAOL